MAASIETQRLISVSLGKIAQSRGQRGGINLHKNLLVATVLHKARTQYMMENFNYQHQQQTLQRQQLLQQEQIHHQQILQQQQLNSAEMARGNESPVASDEVFEASCESEVGQAAGSEEGSQTFVPPLSDSCEDAQGVLVTQECETSAVDKENNPTLAPEAVTHCVVETENTENVFIESEHVLAANKLSQEAQYALVQDNSCQQKQNFSSGSTTCNGILKRRRENVPESECSVSKKARVCQDISPAQSLILSSPSMLCSAFSDFSSSDDSDSESDELTAMHTDSSQITNLVSIFNSGFSGLCATQGDASCNENCYQSDLDVSSPPQYTTLTKMRPESPSSYRNMSDPSLLCSAEVGRMGSLQSALILSA